MQNKVVCCSYMYSSITTLFFPEIIVLKDVRPSDKFDNPYLIIPSVTNDNSEHLSEPVSGTCLRVLCTLLYLHEHCPYITYYCFCCQSFIIILKKMLAVGINLQHSHCNIVFLIIQFKLCLYIFCTTLKSFILNNCFS